MSANGPQEVSGRWSMRKRDLGVAVWIAFLSASVGTFFLFGLVDPAEVENAWMQHWDISRKLAYSLGFLMFFLVCLLSSSLTVFMIRTGPDRGHVSGNGRRPAPAINDPTRDNPDLDIEDLQ